MSTDRAYDKLVANVRIIDARLERASKRLGLSPRTTDVDLVTDAGMLQNMVYDAMPVHYRHWRYGYQAEQIKTLPSHVFEVVINTDPGMCYISTTNSIVMQMLVLAHAKFGHMDYYTNNFLFGETDPAGVLKRFRDARDFVDDLVAHPDWRYDGVELYLDAAHSIEYHIGWLPTLPGEHEQSEDEQRQGLLHDLRTVKSRRDLEPIGYRKELHERDIAELENQLKHHPLNPTADILGFLAEPSNTQHLPQEARQLLKIVRDTQLYFQPQARTKIMNEGWATYWHKELMTQPELALPVGLRIEAARYWTMFDQSPMNWYLDPYALGEALFRNIDETYGFDEGTEEVRYKDLDWDETSQKLVQGRRWKVRTVTKRNRDKLMEVRRNYEDKRFLYDFLTKEFFESINKRVLVWLVGENTWTAQSTGIMEIINKRLKDMKWGALYTREELPPTLSGLMELVEAWMSASEASREWHDRLGTPPFPINPKLLQQIGQCLQMVAAFDQDWQAAKQSLIRRSGLSMIPQIDLVDTGRHTDGVWTFRHHYDSAFGPLLPSEAEETLRFVRLLCGAPCRLLTMEVDTDALGRPGEPYPLIYFTEDGDTVLRQKA